MSKAQSTALSATSRHGAFDSFDIRKHIDEVRAKLRPGPDAPRLSHHQRMVYFTFGLLLGCAVLVTSPLVSNLV